MNGKQYVGQTIRGIKKRWSCHLKDARRGGDGLLGRALRKYGAGAFSVVVIDVGYSVDDLNHKESTWIATHKTLAPDGYNLTTGGARCVFSDDVRKKIGDAHRGRTPHPNNIAVTIHRNRTRVWTEEDRQHMREVQTGKTASQKTKDKLSRNRKGKPLSPQAREASRLARTGAVTPPEVRQKMREAKLGKEHTVGAKQAMSAAQNRRWNEKNFLSFVELQLRVRELGISNARDYMAYATTQDNIPCNPHIKYRDDWKGWEDFLGRTKRLSYTEAVQLVSTWGIQCAREYQEYLNTYSTPGLPKYPNVSYAKEGWGGWAEFLGASKFVAYTEAASTVQPMGFSGSREYMAWVRDTHPRGFPSWPSKTYKGKGWLSWDVFLGKSPEVTKTQAV